MEAGGLLPRQSQQPGPPGPNQLQPQIVNSISQQLQQEQQQQLQLHQQHQMGQAPEIVPRGSQVASSTVERLRKRMGLYRERHKDIEPKFDRTFHGICEQGVQETLLLKQRFVDSSKAKRQPKKNDKKQNDTIISTTLSNNIHVQQKFLKRPTEDLESTPGVKSEPTFGEPPVKLQCTQSSSANIAHQAHVQQQSNNPPPNSGSGNNIGAAASGNQAPPSNSAQGGTNNNTGKGNNAGTAASEDLSKFSVEIVQQFEFSTASSQAQQISTNVTVKALTNASVKSEHLSSSSPIKTEQSTTTSTGSSNSSAQASSNSGSASGNGNSATINTSADIINSLVECKQEPDNDFDLEQCAAALEKDPCFPGFVVDFMNDEVGHEDALKDLISEISDFHPQINFPNISKDLDFEEKPLEAPNNGINIKVEDDKERVHMPPSQHHHHSHQQQQQQQGPLSSQYSPGAGRMAYSGLDFKSEINPAAQTLKQMAEQHQHKNQQLSGGGFNSTASAAAAVAAAARVPNARSPYGEFNQFSNVSTEYINSPQGSIGSQIPPNVTYHKSNGANSVPVKFQNQQSDSIYIQQQRQTTTTQNNVVTNKSGNMLGSGGPNGPAGSGYKQQYSPYGSPGSMPNHGSPGYSLPTRISQGPNQGSNSQTGFNSSTPPRPPSGSGASNIQINQAQQLHINSAHPIQVSAGQHMQLSGDLKPGNVSVAAHQGIYFNQQQQQAPPQQQQSASNNQNETYCSVSQSQTINFTQQGLRQRPATGGVGATGSSQQQTRGHSVQPQSTQIQQQQPQQHSAGGAQLSEQHTKLIQHNMMRVQQQQQQRQQHLSSTLAGGIVRPPPPEYPPPEYKATQAQVLHAAVGGGQQPRLSAPIRRVNQQPIPPSGPMMRPQMTQQTAAMHASNSMYIGTGGVNIGTGPSTAPSGMNAIGGMHQMQQKLGFPRTNNPRSPNINLGPTDNLGNNVPSRGNNQNWQQQLFIQQQQNQQQQHHQGGFGPNVHINSSQMQHQQLLRSQISGPGMNNIPLHQMVVPQQQQQQQMNNQMGMQMQMSQTQTMSTVSSNNGNGSSVIPHQYTSANPSARGSLQSHVHAQQQQLTDTSVNSADLANFDFLDNLPAGDTSNFNPQELLNSLDSGFNFDSIL